MSDLKDAIDYAIRNNAQESLFSSEEALTMLDRVRNGEITFDDMRSAIDFKAHALRRGVTMSLQEALEAVKMAQK